MSISHNYYQLLGVNNDASKLDIQLAYKRLVKLHHPDANFGQPPTRINECEQIMKQLNEAYNVLYDDNQRIHYDRSVQFNPTSNHQEHSAQKYHQSNQPHIVWEVTQDFWHDNQDEFTFFNDSDFAIVDWDDLEYQLETVKTEIEDTKIQYDELRWQLMILDENFADHPGYFARKQELLFYLRQIKNHLQELKFIKKDLKQQIRDQYNEYDNLDEDYFG